MKKKIDWNEIAQHLEQGDSGEVDEQALGDSQVIWQKSAELGKKIQSNTDMPDIDAAMSKMYTRINQSTTQLADQESKIRPLPQRNFLRYAAAAAIIFMLGYVAVQNISPDNTALQANQVYKNEKPATQSLNLSDGTTVTLGSGSELSYPENFNAKTRTVNLKGEAFFDVQRDEQKPFIIATKAATVQVLGTSFNLDAQDDQVKLDVKTGKVAFSNEANNKLLYVTANQTATYDAATDILRKDISEESYIEWDNNRVRYATIPLINITQIFEYRNGISFTFEDEALQAKSLSGSIKASDDVGDALRRAFESDPELAFVWEGKQVHIKYRN